MKKFLLSIVVALMAICGAKAEEQVIFEGSEALGWGGTSLKAMTLEASENVVMEITIETTTAEWWQFKVVANVDGWPSINLGGNEFVNSNNAPEMDWENPKTYTYEYELDAEQIASAKIGLVVQGSINAGDLLLKKVVVKEKGDTGVEAIATVATGAETINLFGQKANEAQGFMVKGGKKVFVK